MKKQINKYLFVLFALIIISITAIGSASASEDIHGFDLSESDSSSCLNDHFTNDIISGDLDPDDDDDSNLDEDEDLDDNNPEDYSDLDDDDDSDLDDDDSDIDDDDSDLDDDDSDLDDEDLDDLDDDFDMDDYLDEDYLAYQDLVMRYHKLLEKHPDAYSKLIPYIIYIVNDNGNISNINFTEIFKDNNASDEESSDDDQIDEDIKENLTEEEYSFENATQKVLELIETDESFSSSVGDLTIKLTGLVNKIVDILNSTENFTADFKNYLESEISAENSTGESEYLDFLIFIYDLINYAENHTGDNFSLLDIYKSISSGYHIFLATGFSGAASAPETSDNEFSHNPIDYDMKINNKINNSLNSDNQNVTSLKNSTDSVSTQSADMFNLIILILVLLAVLFGVKIKRDNN